MADSNRDSDSVGSAVACKARKGAEGSFAFKTLGPSTSQALAIVPARPSARVQQLASFRQQANVPGLPQSHRTAPRLLPSRLQTLLPSLWQLC